MGVGSKVSTHFSPAESTLTCYSACGAGASNPRAGLPDTGHSNGHPLRGSAGKQVCSDVLEGATGDSSRVFGGAMPQQLRASRYASCRVMSFAV